MKLFLSTSLASCLFLLCPAVSHAQSSSFRLMPTRDLTLQTQTAAAPTAQVATVDSDRADREAEADLHDNLTPVRAIVGPLLGYVISLPLGSVGGFFGSFLGCGTGLGGSDSDTDPVGCGLGLSIGWGVTGAFLAPLGPTLLGEWAHGRSGYGTAVLGGLVGWAGQILLSALTGAVSGEASTTLYVSMVLTVLPAIGSMIAYEIESGDQNYAERDSVESAFNVMPTLAPLVDRQGGLVGGTVGLMGSM